MPIPAGYGFDNAFGAPRVQTLQLGFVSVITAAYDASVGYAWKRLYLDSLTHAFTEPTQLWEGDLAFHPLGLTDIPVGTYCWQTVEGGSRAGWVIMPLFDNTSNECAGDGWMVALRESDCLSASLVTESGSGSGSAAGVTLTSSNGTTWTTADALEICDGLWVPTFTPDDDGRATMTMTFMGSASAEGSGSDAGGDFSVTGRLDCAGCNYAVFAFSRYAMCPCAEPSSGGPCANVVKVRIEWVECAAPDACVGSGGGEFELPAQVTFQVTQGWMEPLGAVNLPYYGLQEVTGYHTYYSALAVPFPHCPEGGFITGVAVFFGCVDGLPSLVGASVGYTDSAHTLAGNCDVPSVAASSLDPLTYEVTPGGSCWGDPGLPGCTFDYAAYQIATPNVVLITAGPVTPDFAPGYTTPGWYVLEGDAVAYIDDSNKCGPYQIICGPYDTEGEAETAAADDCGCDSIAGWLGAGWYCVYSIAEAGCVAAELLDADRCDTGILICSGPYADEATAEIACEGGGSGGGPPGTLACCDAYEPSPGVGATTGTFTRLSATGTCGGWSAAGGLLIEVLENGGAVVTSNGNVQTGMWIIFGVCDENTGEWTFNLVAEGQGGPASAFRVSGSCDESGITEIWEFTFVGGNPCTGTVRYQFTMT